MCEGLWYVLSIERVDCEKSFLKVWFWLKPSLITIYLIYLCHVIFCCLCWRRCKSATEQRACSIASRAWWGARAGSQMPQVRRSVPLAPPRSTHLSLAPARTRVYLYVLSFGGFKPNPPWPQSALRRPPRPRPRRRRLSLATAAAAAEPHRLARETLSEVDECGRTSRINSCRELRPQLARGRLAHRESHHDRAAGRTRPHIDTHTHILNPFYAQRISQ